MHPILLKIGPLSIPSYGVMILLGVMAALFIGKHLAKIQHLPLQPLSDLAIYTLLIALVGARILLIITEMDQFLKHPKQLLAMLTSAGNFFGGLIAGGIFAFFYIRKKGLPLWPVLDVAAPAIAIGHFFGRLGCLLAGCCWGQPAANCAVAITFHNHETQTGVPLNSPLYPTQATEALFNLAMAILLFFLFKKKKFSGQIFSIYLMAYGAYRFLSEYFRGDTGRGYLFGDISNPLHSLSVPQLMALCAVFIGLAIYIHGQRKA